MNVTLIYRFPVISLLSARFLIWVCLSFCVLVTSPFLPCWKNPSGSKVLLQGVAHSSIKVHVPWGVATVIGILVLCVQLYGVAHSFSRYACPGG